MITESNDKALDSALISVLHLFKGDYSSESDIKMMDWSEIDAKTKREVLTAAKTLVKHLQ